MLQILLICWFILAYGQRFGIHQVNTGQDTQWWFSASKAYRQHYADGKICSVFSAHLFYLSVYLSVCILHGLEAKVVAGSVISKSFESFSVFLHLFID